MILKKKALENNMGKGENAGNQHFLLFAKSFLLQHREIAIFITFNLLFANAFNLVASEILSFGKEISLLKTLWKKEAFSLFPHNTVYPMKEIIIIL